MTFHLAPFVLAFAFLLIEALAFPSGHSVHSVIAFGLAGPGLLSPAPAHDQPRSGRTSLRCPRRCRGGVIAFYQVGYGIAAFGVGPLQDAGVSLPALFAATAVVALVLAGLAGVLAAREPAPAPAPA